MLRLEVHTRTLLQHTWSCVVAVDTQAYTVPGLSPSHSCASFSI